MDRLGLVLGLGSGLGLWLAFALKCASILYKFDIRIRTYALYSWPVLPGSW